MAEATLRSGDPETIPYTPGADVDEGEVLLLGNTAGICLGVAQRPIANGVLGALAYRGGQWAVVNLNNAADYAKVWWDNSAKKITTVSTNNALFGFIADGGGGGANSTAYAALEPLV